MDIINQEVTRYINGFYRPFSPFLEDLRLRSEAENIPILSRESETFLLMLLEMKRPKRILEIGTAVGYSAILFASALDNAHITTLEIQEWLCERARKNFKKAGVEDQIRILQGDARETLSFLAKEKDSETLEPFDFVFIDGATNHYKEIWDKCMGLCKSGTVIVADNIFYKGGTISNEYLDHPRNKTIASRMREYVDHVTAAPGVRTTIASVGDGIAVSVLI